MRHGHATRADLADAALAVAELLGDPGGGAISLEEPARRGNGTETAKRELEDSCPHLGADSASLERCAEPRAGLDGTAVREARPGDAHRSRKPRALPDEKVGPPCVGAPVGELLLVVGPELFLKSRVRNPIAPGNAERHLLRRVDPPHRECRELVDLGGRPEAELEPRRAQSQVEERCEVDHSSNPSG